MVFILVFYSQWGRRGGIYTWPKMLQIGLISRYGPLRSEAWGRSTIVVLVYFILKLIIILFLFINLFIFYLFLCTRILDEFVIKLCLLFCMGVKLRHSY